MLLYHYVMSLGRRCFPNRKVYPRGYNERYKYFDNSVEGKGLLGKKELVSLGYLCDEDYGDLFDCGTDYYNESDILFIGKRDIFSEDGQIYPDANSISTIVENAKPKLSKELQLIYGELCIAKDMDLHTYIGLDKLNDWFSGLGSGKYSMRDVRPFNGFPDFEFCGYEIMCSRCTLSAFTGFGDKSKYHENKLNRYGLFDDLADAIRMRVKLESDEVDEDLIGTLIYGVWRYVKE